MWIIGAFLITLAVLLIVRMAHTPQHNAACHTSKTPSVKDLENSVAIRILNERYAKGEITDEEYKTKKMNLL